MIVLAPRSQSVISFALFQSVFCHNLNSPTKLNCLFKFSSHRECVVRVCCESEVADCFVHSEDCFGC